MTDTRSDPRVEALLDQLTNSTLSKSEIELIEKKIELIKSTHD